MSKSLLHTKFDHVRVLCSAHIMAVANNFLSGPITPQGTGLLAVESVAGAQVNIQYFLSHDVAAGSIIIPFILS